MNNIAALTAKRIIRYINTFCFILSEDNGEFRKIHFNLRNYQIRAINEMFSMTNRSKNILIEKTRQIGLSWLMAAVYSYIILFRTNEQLLVLGKKEEFIDSAELNPNTLMGKIKFILENFENKAMKAYTRRVIRFHYMHISNKILGTICTGESSASKSGRGTTMGWVWWDETAFTEHDREIFASISPNSRRLVLLSTANGKNTLFYHIKKEIEEGNISNRWHKIRLHWSEYFTQEWYDKQKGELGNDPILIAQELDIDYEQSTRERIFYNFGEKVWREDLFFQQKLSAYSVLSFDYGIRDNTAAVLIQFNPHAGEYYITDATEFNNIPFELFLSYIETGNTFFLEEMKRKTDQKYWKGMTRFALNAIHHKYKRLLMTGDPAGSARGLTEGHNIEELFFQKGFRYMTFRDRSEPVLSAIRGRADHIFIYSHLDSVRSVIQNWSYVLDKEGNPLKPKHDIYSHIGTALKYGFNFIFKNFEGGLKFAQNNSIKDPIWDE